MRKLWLIFSQAVTVGLAGLFVVGTFRPEWLQARKPQATISVSQGARTHTPAGSLAPAAGRAAASVVSITTSKADKHKADPWAQLLGEEGEDDEPSGMGMGSGVVASAEGHILTNHHVVAGADDIEVMLPDGRQLRAQVVGTDPDTDLAILKIQADKLTPITFGNSDDLQIGDAVLALGNPFGVGQTVTAGIISALNRTQLGLSTFENFIQTDAAINPGNSGGALVDTEGRLLGINSAIYSRSGGSMGIGFAIPVSTARQVMEQIIKDGRVVRGWIGVELRPLNRYKLRVSKTFRWRPRGPVMQFFRERVVQDFFDAGFDGEGELLMLVHGQIGRAQAALFAERLQRLAQDFAQQHLADQKLPPSQKQAYTMVIGMRSWLFAAFRDLKRHPD
jgi:S1-C subfamily serine protease